MTSPLHTAHQRDRYERQPTQLRQHPLEWRHRSSAGLVDLAAVVEGHVLHTGRPVPSITPTRPEFFAAHPGID